MIDWELTKLKFKICDISGYRPQVVVRCDKCSKTTRIIRIRNKSKVDKNNQMAWLCHKCVSTSISKQLSNKTRSIWKDSKYRNKTSTSIKLSSSDENYKAKQRNKSIKTWSNQEYRTKMGKMISSRWNDKEYRSKMLIHLDKIRNSIEHKEAVRTACRTDEFRNKMKKLWNDKNYKMKMAQVNATRPKVSSIQILLYKMLDDLDIEYYREYNDKEDDSRCKIGPYCFDCVIPRDNKPDLLIECQGDYWHSTKEAMIRDRQKASYIENNFPNLYELKYLWEHEFKCHQKVYELLKYWIGLTKDELVDFQFDDVEIIQTTKYNDLLNKYHYLPGIGRGGIAYGGYLNKELISVCVFSPLMRHNIRIGEYDKNQVRELSRFCIHPRYQKRNFASWFISRCIKLLPDKYKCIISYSDTTFNHDGTIYKACNFKLDKEVKPDYWYMSEDGWIMHKKTLYNHARKCHLTESEFASTNNYTKIYGNKKLRYIYYI